MAHSFHQFAEVCPGLRDGCDAGMAQVVKVKVQGGRLRGNPGGAWLPVSETRPPPPIDDAAPDGGNRRSKAGLR